MYVISRNKRQSYIMKIIYVAPFFSIKEPLLVVNDRTNPTKEHLWLKFPHNNNKIEGVSFTPFT